jgi:hypothetical protein
MKLAVAHVVVHERVNSIVDIAEGRRLIARNWRSCWLVLSSKLPKSSIIGMKPPSFISPAAVAVMLIIWMEADSHVVGG